MVAGRPSVTGLPREDARPGAERGAGTPFPCRLWHVEKKKRRVRRHCRASIFQSDCLEADLVPRHLLAGGAALRLSSRPPFAAF